jgi:hypothetical protein
VKSYSYYSALPLAVFICGLVVAIYASYNLKTLAREPANEGISHVMPAPVSLLLAGGDRFLAADLTMFRVIISVGEGPIHFKDRAALQMQIAVFNPFFEDNYYQTSASLPWEGFVEEAQFILTRASDARLNDPWPSFFNGFTEYYFRQNFVSAAEHVLVSAERSSGTNKMLFKDVAAKWLSRGANYQLALGMVVELEKNTKSPVTKANLKRRIQRLENLIELEDAMTNYESTYNKKLSDIESLLQSNIISNIPADPWGNEYIVVAGKIIVKGDSDVRQSY